MTVPRGDSSKIGPLSPSMWRQRASPKTRANELKRSPALSPSETPTTDKHRHRVLQRIQTDPGAGTASSTLAGQRFSRRSTLLDCSQHPAHLGLNELRIDHRLDVSAWLYQLLRTVGLGKDDGGYVLGIQ
jgi:hypothetical protein